MPADDGLAEKLTKLAKLHADGALSDEEFKAAKALIISEAPKAPEGMYKAGETGGKTSSTLFDNPLKWQSPPSQGAPDKDAEGWRSVIGGVLLFGAIAGVIAWDHLVGRLLPDEMYCAVGAGREWRETRANSWSANGGCRAYIPGCETSWVTTKSCLHGSIWDALKAQLHYR